MGRGAKIVTMVYHCTETPWYGERCRLSMYCSCVSVPGRSGIGRGVHLVSMVHVPVYKDTMVWREVPT